MRVIFLSLIVLVAACNHEYPSVEVAAVTAPAEVTVITSQTDNRDYRYTELVNGIKVLLISDPEATKAAASMKIDVGSYSDPVDREGLAHFLEHMLFLGTEKYPKMGDYSAYLEANGGSSNAYTAAHLTNYHFAINADAYAGALDRFAQFFIAPLFSADLVDREKNAIHSEYSTRLGQDPIGEAEVIETVMNSEHPAHKFNVGNLETLIDTDDRSLRDELIEFYNRFYTAEGMALVLLSNASLDELQAMAVSKFSAVPNQGQVPSKDYEPLFKAGELPKIVEIQPNKEIRQLSLFFPMPSFQNRYQAKPLSFLAMLIGQEGSGSLHDVLKEKGWIESLAAGAGQNYGNSDSFSIKTTLTKTGVEHVDDIIAALYDKINLIRVEGIEQWRYDELSKITEPQFRFRGKGNALHYVISLANSVGKFAPQDLLRGHYLLTDYDDKLINIALDNLVASNMLVTLMAPGVETDSQVHFYGTKYRSFTPSAERVASWQKSQFAELRLPVVNPYIPDSLDLIADTAVQKPQLLDATGAIEVWHYPNTSFGVPRVYVQISLDHAEKPSAHETAVQMMYYSLIAEQFNEVNSYANNAGLGFSVSDGGKGALLKFGGFSDKLTTLASTLLPQLRHPKFTDQQFERVLTSLQRRLANREQEVPYRRLGMDLLQLLIEKRVSDVDLLAASKAVTAAEVRALPTSLFSNVRMQVLAAGNITEQQARDLVTQVADELALSNTAASVQLGERIVRLVPSPQTAIFVKALPHPDAAVVRYYQGRDNSLQERARLLMLSTLLHQPYYQDLRTKQQLGYVVAARNITLDTVPGVAFMVQSPAVSATQIEAATDKFLPEFQHTLAAMSEHEFARQRQALVIKYQERPKNLAEQVAKFWGSLRADYPLFDKDEKLVAAIAKLSLVDLQNTYDSVFMREPRSLSVVSPGKKGGVVATVDSEITFQKNKGSYVRRSVL